MNYHFTLYIGKEKIGTITSYQNSRYFFILTDQTAQRLDLQTTDKVVDDGLRNLSVSDYVIITDKYIYYKNKVYKSTTDLPVYLKYIILPITSSSDICEYIIQNQFDDLFIIDRYVSELKDAELVLIPPSLVDNTNNNKNYILSDLLIKNQKDDIFISFNDRKTTNLKIKKKDGRYLYLLEEPLFTGNVKVLPVTYTKDSLLHKCKILNNKLNNYSQEKIKSMCVSLSSLPNKIKSLKNTFRASLLYDDIVAILDKIKEIE